MAETTGKRLLEIAVDTRSDTYQWLWRNHAEITAVIATYAKPPWKALVNAAAAEGLVCTTDALRKAWLRLERDRAREAKRHPGKPPPEAPPPASAERKPAPEAGAFDFKFSSPKRWTD